MCIVDLSQHGRPVVGDCWNDEFVQVVSEEILGKVGLSVATVVQRQDLTVIVDQLQQDNRIYQTVPPVQWCRVFWNLPL